jgi:hypothetical protein
MLHNPCYVTPARAIHLSPATRRVYIILVMPTLGNTRIGDTPKIPGVCVADPDAAARENLARHNRFLVSSIIP